MLSALTEADLINSRNYGVYTLPGVAGAYPDLAKMVRIMYRDRFAKLSFVPPGWFDGVNALLGVDGAMVLPVPAFDNFKHPSPNMPAWLDTDAKRQAWEDARNALGIGYRKFTQDQIDQGRIELDKLYADVAFWQRLEDAARFFANIPKSIAMNGLRVLIVPAIVLGLAWFGWTMLKSKIRKMNES